MWRIENAEILKEIATREPRTLRMNILSPNGGNVLCQVDERIVRNDQKTRIKRCIVEDPDAYMRSRPDAQLVSLTLQVGMGRGEQFKELSMCAECKNKSGAQNGFKEEFVLVCARNLAFFPSARRRGTVDIPVVFYCCPTHQQQSKGPLTLRIFLYNDTLLCHYELDLVLGSPPDFSEPLEDMEDVVGDIVSNYAMLPMQDLNAAIDLTNYLIKMKEEGREVPEMLVYLKLLQARLTANVKSAHDMNIGGDIRSEITDINYNKLRRLINNSTNWGLDCDQVNVTVKKTRSDDDDPTLWKWETIDATNSFYSGEEKICFEVSNCSNFPVHFCLLHVLGENSRPTFVTLELYNEYFRTLQPGQTTTMGATGSLMLDLASPGQTERFGMFVTDQPITGRLFDDLENWEIATLVLTCR